MLVHTWSGDPSGYFHYRTYHDPDGVAPWAGFDVGAIAAFQILAFGFGGREIPTAGPLGGWDRRVPCEANGDLGGW